MINVFFEKDLARAIDEYIKLRETVGLARDTAKFGAIKTVLEYASLRQAVEEDSGLKLIDQSRVKTDKLPPLAQ